MRLSSGRICRTRRPKSGKSKNRGVSESWCWSTEEASKFQVKRINRSWRTVLQITKSSWTGKRQTRTQKTIRKKSKNFSLSYKVLNLTSFKMSPAIIWKSARNLGRILCQVLSITSQNTRSFYIKPHGQSCRRMTQCKTRAEFWSSSSLKRELFVIGSSFKSKTLKVQGVQRTKSVRVLNSLQ